MEKRIRKIIKNHLVSKVKEERVKEMEKEKGKEKGKEKINSINERGLFKTIKIDIYSFLYIDY
jgi:hypothetical protein